MGRSVPTLEPVAQKWRCPSVARDVRILSFSRVVTERTMGWVVFALWLLLTPIWIRYWSAAGSSAKMAFIPPALVLVAFGFHWLWRRFVVIVAGEHEPAPRGRIRELTADWRAERDLVFRPKRDIHPVWGVALPSRVTIRLALIAGAAGACVGAAVVSHRASFEPAIFTTDGASRTTSRSDSPLSVRTEAVKPTSFSAASGIVNSAPVPSPRDDSNSQRAELQPSSTNAQTSSARPSCDVSFCERLYRSFRASDCSYQPYEGPRQYCAR
jgi:BA14K-like protein